MHMIDEFDSMQWREKLITSKAYVIVDQSQDKQKGGFSSKSKNYSVSKNLSEWIFTIYPKKTTSYNWNKYTQYFKYLH